MNNKHDEVLNFLDNILSLYGKIKDNDNIPEEKKTIILRNLQSVSAQLMDIVFTSSALK